VQKVKSIRLFAWVVVFFIAAMFSHTSYADSPAPDTNSLIDVSEVLQGRIFDNTLDRDVFFLREVHNRYPSSWPPLLQANLTVHDYIVEPVKMLRFINELGIAMADKNDNVASTNLAFVVADGNFFTNELAYRPEIIRAAVQTLIQIGPNGRKALASAFTESRYRENSESLEKLAAIIGEERPPGTELPTALAATAFTFSTANGGIYSRCTTEAVKNLLHLPEGAPQVSPHLNTNEIFDNPGRFQAVVDGINAAHATELATNLAAIGTNVTAKLAILTNSPGDYRDDLQDLQTRIQKTLASFAKPNQNTR
jgi:hypothetical protein